MKVSVHVNSRYVDSDKYDLDVYDRYTLERAIMSLANSINYYMSRGRVEEAQPYLDFKNRIKNHLNSW